MKFRVIETKCCDSRSAVAELLFELASARADSLDFLRIDFLQSDEQESTKKRAISAIKRVLKAKKESGYIQFFAFSDNFEHKRTESVFLFNKYPDHFSTVDLQSGKSEFLYIKL